MRTLNTEPLVIQELTEFCRGPLHQALSDSGLRFSYGDENTGAEFDDMAFAVETRTALVEVTGDGSAETGRVIGYGRGTAVVFDAIHAYTEQFGAPVTFQAVLSPEPEPPVYTGGSTRIVR